jgi:hypothetical protein
MANIKLDTVRGGARLLGKLAREARSEEGTKAQRVTPGAVKNFLAYYGDSGSLDKAMNSVMKYAQAKSGNKSPTVNAFNEALGDAVRNTVKGDKNASKDLSPAEQKSLAKTWQSVVAFSKDYKGMSVQQVMDQNDPP